jgi:hypothetical protein
VSAPYTVTWVYRDGNEHFKVFEDFDIALTFYREFKSASRRGTFVVSMHGDGAEHDGERWNDGLTEDERDQL